MLNNSTNINKVNIHPSPQLIEFKKRPRHMTLEIQVLDWDMHKNVAGLSQLIGSWSKMFIYLTIQSFDFDEGYA
jgi:hypothetical protein